MLHLNFLGTELFYYRSGHVVIVIQTRYESEGSTPIPHIIISSARTSVPLLTFTMFCMSPNAPTNNKVESALRLRNHAFNFSEQ